jgi:hypothetical protein
MLRRFLIFRQIGEKKSDRIGTMKKPKTELSIARAMVMTEFALTELTVGLEFASIARESRLMNRFSEGLKQKAEAIKAHQAALNYLPEADPTEEQQTLIERRLDELESALNTLEKLYP